MDSGLASMRNLVVRILHPVYRHLHAADLLQLSADLLSVLAGVAHACIDIDSGYGNLHRLPTAGRLCFVILYSAALRRLFCLPGRFFGFTAVAGLTGAKGQYNGEHQHDRHRLSEHSSLHKAYPPIECVGINA